MSAVMDELNISDIKLAPGEFFFGGGCTRVRTLLGSCVAITMWHPQRRIGGMCHYLLPTRGSNVRLSKGHFADESIGLFLEQVQAASTRPGEYEVKVFGGGNMFKQMQQQYPNLNVPKGNIETGISILIDNGFNIKARDVGGFVHRNIYLELWTGDVWVQRGSPHGGKLSK